MQDQSVEGHLLGDGGRVETRPLSAPVSATRRALLVTKLARPRIPPSYVARPQLARLLDAGTQRPVTVVSGGAGWGKTLTTAAWAEAEPAVGPVAWLSLDETDNEPRSFWRYVLEALRTTVPVAPTNALAGLDLALGREDENLRRLSAGIAELPTPLVLVLDDFHLVQDPAVLAGMASLVRRPLWQLRLVLLTRSDPALPLHRLRVSDELAEIRGRDLAFTVSEASSLLAEDGVNVAPDQAELLVERTEGWPAGLRLAALFLRRTDHVRSVAEFAGDDRAVSDYLWEEVLASQSAEMQQFLMRTSIAQRMSGGLADALVGGSRGQHLLETLESSNAFVVGLGSDRHWFRYHPLMREMLQHQLGIADALLAPELHRRAAQWYAAEGHPVEALRHAMAAGDWGLFGRLFVNQAAPLLISPDRTALGRVLEDVPAERWGDSAELALCGAALTYLQGRLVEMQPHLDLASSLIAETPADLRPATHVALLSLSAPVSRVRGDMASLVASTTETLELLAGAALTLPAGKQYRAVALGNLGTALLWSGRPDDAERCLREALELTEDGLTEAARINMLGHLAVISAGAGRLREGFGYAVSAIELVEERGWSPLPQAAAAYLALAIIHLQWNNLDAARAMAWHSQAGAIDLAPHFARRLVKARMDASLGHVESAEDELVHLRDEVGAWTPPLSLRQWLAVTEAEVAVAAGDPAAAIARLNLSESADGGIVQQRICLATALLADGQPQQAESVLAALRSDPTDGGGNAEVWLLTALVADRMREDNRALDALRRSLELAQVEGVRRPFVAGGTDRLPRLLERIAQVDPGSSQFAAELLADLRLDTVEPECKVLAEPLTDRELSVLRHLPTMMTNTEVAAELYVSVNTVKAHLKRIYRKLDVVNRREAVHRARELGLISRPGQE
jgi:LuxR family maltose regulon positive regulatory protein